VSKNGALTAQMTYDAEGQRVKKVYAAPDNLTVTTTYAGKLYEKRTYSVGTDRNTIYVFANGQVLAAVTTQGAVPTAANDLRPWRPEMAAVAMYDGRSIPGAALRAYHLLKAISLHPATGNWVALGAIGLFASFVMTAFVVSLFRRQRRASRFSLAFRVAGLATLFVFTLAGCGGQGAGSALGVQENYSIILDPVHGPGVGTYYYHHNHVNSSSVITNANGEEVTRLVYLPFGELSQMNSAGGDNVTAKFTGQEYDEEMGLYYFGSRYYDPAIGRFLSPDTTISDMSNAQSFNRYSYVLNNPIRYVDPTGHDEQDPGGWGLDVQPTGAACTPGPCITVTLTPQAPAGANYPEGTPLRQDGKPDYSQATMVGGGPPQAGSLNGGGGYAHIGSGSGLEIAISPQYMHPDVISERPAASWMDNFKPSTWVAQPVIPSNPDARALFDDKKITWQHDTYASATKFVKVAVTVATLTFAAPSIFGRLAMAEAFSPEVVGATGGGAFSPGSVGAGELRILQSGGRTITPATANALNQAAGRDLAPRFWGRALEALKRSERLPNNFHGAIDAVGNYIDPSSKAILGNLQDFLP
jgi:RHS repeat-associated protein